MLLSVTKSALTGVLLMFSGSPKSSFFMRARKKQIYFEYMIPRSASVLRTGAILKHSKSALTGVFLHV